MDVAHSRPHRKYDEAPIEPVEAFTKSVRRVMADLPFERCRNLGLLPPARVQIGDARNLPVSDGSIDVVITSPPYLNAIDYLRGHKLSLVWMQHSIDELRDVRSTNIGTEAGAGQRIGDDTVLQSAFDAGVPKHDLPQPQTGMCTRYLRDMQTVLLEIRRVLKANGRAVLVVGDCTVRGTFVRNSAAIKSLADEAGLTLVSERTGHFPKTGATYRHPRQGRPVMV